MAQALQTWKSSLDDESRKLLSSWVGPDPCKNWTGISCNSHDVIVTSINLGNFQLQGNLDQFNFSALSSSLENLDLGFNNLDGQMPVSLGHLTRLRYLNLEGNTLSGLIPSSFENFTRIEYLYLQQNRLTGPILPKIGNPETLIDLRLFDNYLTGSIPGSLGNYTRLVSLYLHKNQLSGSIPIALGKLETLLDLALSVNNLTGSFPEELNNLTMKLETLALGSNKLSGHLPTRACFSGSLQIFSVNRIFFLKWCCIALVVSQ
ncbi:hypothetical protein L1987_79680 [Smallanthus sonchifolius]|uniref:Uncharacterized protein n=1 Tax=Smallanthus sonchifolius TaxID=185202 RepID=A0ACB8YL88_9ASTR|nr:hypothetical protein L1987_79680 [Smallanthus sonchifolius]